MEGAAAFGLTLAELCDVVYVMLWQDRQQAAHAAGIADLREERQLFDAALVDESPLSTISADELDLRRALGVA